MSSRDDVTQLLIDWSHGDKGALRRLTPIVLDDLHRQAASYLSRERTGHTLQATALVNEVFLRLVDQTRVRWRDRAHFFAVAAQFMRRILVDSARAHRTDKRGGWAEKVRLDEASDVPVSRDIDLVALDEALEALAVLDERQARIVELRFFAGLTIDETSEVMGIAKSTVNRDWRDARAWLHRELARR